MNPGHTHSAPRAIVDRGELVETLRGAGNPLKKLYAHLEPMTWLGFFVSLPAFAVRPMLLISRQSIEPMSAENPMHRGTSHGEAMKALQIVSNPAGTKMVGLPQVQDLADDVRRGRSRRAPRCPRPVT